MSKTKQDSKKSVLIFDMNETLLDLTKVRKSVSEALSGGEEVVSLWFETMLHYSLVDTVSKRYHNFGEIGAAALMMIAKNRDINLTMEKAKKALNPISSSPPFPDVPAALELLKQHGFRMAVLTNSSQKGMQTQLKHAGIAHYFEQALSVEEVSKFKPHKEVYHWAARQLKVKPEHCLLIAAHGWDVAGAMAARMRAAFLNRPGQSRYLLAPQPNFIEPDLERLVAAL